MCNPVVIGAEERIDDLLIGQLKVIQHEKEFCFYLDAKIGRAHV